MAYLTNAKRWFAAQKGERLVHSPVPAGLMVMGGFHVPAWENRPVPSPGPMAYAYEGLTQQSQGALGRAGLAYRPQPVTSPMMLVALGTQTIQGTGIGTGTFYQQPLYQPTPG